MTKRQVRPLVLVVCPGRLYEPIVEQPIDDMVDFGKHLPRSRVRLDRGAQGGLHDRHHQCRLDTVPHGVGDQQQRSAVAQRNDIQDIAGDLLEKPYVGVALRVRASAGEEDEPHRPSLHD